MMVRLPVTHDPSVAALLDAYWTEHASRIPSAEQAEIGIRHLKAHFIGNLSSITRQSVEAYRRRRNRGEIGRPAIDNTVRRELGGILLPALNHAAKERRISKGDIPHIALPPASPPRDRWLTPEEADRLREACQWVSRRGSDGRYQRVRVEDPTRVRLFVELALGIAARRGAIENLRKDQVDLESGLIHLNPKGRLQTKKRRPTVPVPDRLQGMLAWAIEHMPGPFVLGHNGPIRMAFAMACERAGLDGVTAHTLRHTWATWAAQRGVPLIEIAAVLGDRYETVERNYLHWTGEYLKRAVNF